MIAELTALASVLHSTSHETELRAATQTLGGRIVICKNSLILPYPGGWTFPTFLSVTLRLLVAQILTKGILCIPICLADQLSVSLEQAKQSNFLWHRRLI